MVNTGALVSYNGGNASGASTYSWRLPYPYDVVSSIDYFAQNWQMQPTNGSALRAFTGYSKQSGYVQLMGVNKCGTGGAKLLYVSHGGGGPGGGGIPIIAPGGSLTEHVNSEKDGIVLYPNPANEVVHISIKKNNDQNKVLPTRILGVQIVDQLNVKRKEFKTENKGNESAAIDVSTLQQGYYTAIINTDIGIIIKKMLIE